MTDLPVARLLDGQLERHAQVTEAMREQLPQVEAVAEELIRRLEAGGVLYTFGNGGSAADAQHLAGELIGRYLRERRPLPAIALIGDAAGVSCLPHHFSFHHGFPRPGAAPLPPQC